MPSADQVVTWLIVGLIGGSLAGFATTFDRRGHGIVRNLLVGLVGALVGGFLVRLLGLWPSLEGVSISARDVVAAFLGSLIVLVALWLWQRARGPA